MTVVNAKFVQVFNTAVHADHIHQRVSRGSIMGFRHGSPERLRTDITSASVVFREGIIALGIFPAGNR